MLEGEAVRSLTAQFLQMWGILKEPEYEQFLTRPIPVPENAKGVAAGGGMSKARSRQALCLY